MCTLNFTSLGVSISAWHGGVQRGAADANWKWANHTKMHSPSGMKLDLLVRIGLGYMHTKF